MNQEYERKIDEEEVQWDGCYGSKVKYSELGDFLDDAFQSNAEAEESGGERFSTCIWGHSGIGKTAFTKQFCKKPVTWRGKEYNGYKIYDVPIAQFEEMGDLHGMPSRHVFVRRETEARWVPEEVLQGYLNDEWMVDPDAGVKTMYAPPDWVPTEEGPTILLLDDWNRASIRIIKGIMQLLQNYGMVSWKLPAGCNIVLTANPDEQDYLVTSLDSAILTRIRSITLKPDVPEWALWAEGQNLDHRGISWALLHPEMVIGKERTNPRTLAEYFRFMRRIGSVGEAHGENGRTKEQEGLLKRLKMMGHALLDPETVRGILTYFDRDVNLVISPEEILKGSHRVSSHISKMMNEGTERRVDVVSVMCDRLFSHLVHRECEPVEEEVRNFQNFLTIKDIPDDMKYFMVNRVGEAWKKNRGFDMHRWIIGNDELMEFVKDLL